MQDLRTLSRCWPLNMVSTYRDLRQVQQSHEDGEQVQVLEDAEQVQALGDGDQVQAL